MKLSAWSGWHSVSHLGMYNAVPFHKFKLQFEELLQIVLKSIWTASMHFVCMEKLGVHMDNFLPGA